jgi:hypothetical protein
MFLPLSVRMNAATQNALGKEFFLALLSHSLEEKLFSFKRLCLRALLVFHGAKRFSWEPFFLVVPGHNVRMSCGTNNGYRSLQTVPHWASKKELFFSATKAKCTFHSLVGHTS